MSNYVSTTITVPRSEYDAVRSAAARSASLSEQVTKLTDDNSALQANLDRANQRAAQASQRFDQAMEQLRKQNEKKEMGSLITKNKKNDPDRLEMHKYCRFCKKHTAHKETR